MYTYRVHQATQCCGYPYIQGSSSNKRTGLATLEKKLFQSDESFADKFGKIANGAQWAKVVLTLPRFKIESKWDMSDLCKELGMNVAFTDRADFSLMTQNKMQLTIGQIVQKAFVEVNEEGTVAAAATANFVMTTSVPPPPIYFTADHPFIVTISSISDRTILFIAKLANLE
uniref:Heterochromatin-associated protein MENT n=1 Tax=Cacopsylla melanoneura TaxID=428564 RepID=A0A8D9E248_9HEMI